MGTDDVDGARGRFESALRALSGRRLATVDYWDVHNFGPEPALWNYGDWHHAIMGVELGTGLGPVTVTWTDTFYPYGVEVLFEPIEHRLALGNEGPERVGPDCEGMRAWASCLGSPIRHAECHWERLRIGPGRRADGSVTGPAYSIDVPVAVRLDFPTTAVWLVAGTPQFPDARGAFIPADEIMVVFSPEKMRDLGFEDTTFLRTPD
ncbi:hypothetical protein DFJ67_6993 [Asanoa ferruginea]|uniref:Uncharacterized protein n=1 Tax=Asanoa ferruginea TaxID=53367 RepID=A0A3D9ZUQ4_9ACTN|nr:hypothetical protein [Asanoa ferruginea]REG00932.1 hypothetical protein DFJ67_6993 [Asanoa ferruginea]GIF47517.1 hypothetical protein Afe04nite_20560 [Asanoa ferruginea]